MNALPSAPCPLVRVALLLLLSSAASADRPARALAGARLLLERTPGSSTELRVHLYNAGRAALWVWPQRTITHASGPGAYLWLEVFDRTLQPIAGRCLPEPYLVLDPYVEVKPRSAVFAVADLARCWALPGPGRYFVVAHYFDTYDKAPAPPPHAIRPTSHLRSAAFPVDVAAADVRTR